MQICFQAEETVKLEVKQQAIPIQHYLRQPSRLVKAIADRKLMTALKDDCYRLQMHPLSFLDMYHFQPTAVLKVWSGASGNVYVNSVSCEIKGIEYLNRRFSLQLKGKLTPTEIEGKVYLQGKANLTVTVDLPPPLWFTPKSLLLTTGNSLLKGVLVRIKNKLMSQLLNDYYDFVKSEQEKTHSLGWQEA
ncbi:DUF1997 domain-containing protein [Cyanobacterium aponinum UTEX 3222]|uniref:DUF1997 domain-containing protein n=1 Tax=Cyanobacterium aponinum TaxID=379064 RepID=UPI002B4BBFE3|nr:DUF1997 domain-containing protein [Cyanobacterium aponinum]WRL36889.1 DUF1997 domain-containing protein [Cyanobacterium aponinum UTEX 3221]WRL43221.1 DUF1997 domain-containing protein [Cyanobacterium aponinum UTEX 3222]